MGKYSPALTKTTPPDAASRKFQQAAMTPMKSATDGFYDQSVFDACNATKVFNRKANRYGNDEAASIKQYDESVVDEGVYEERKKNAHKKKGKKRHVFVNGQWKGVASQAGNNKEAKKDARRNYGKGKVEIAKESILDFNTVKSNDPNKKKPFDSNEKPDVDTNANTGIDDLHNDMKSWLKNKQKNKKKDDNSADESTPSVDENVEALDIIESFMSVLSKRKSCVAGGTKYHMSKVEQDDKDKVTDDKIIAARKNSGGGRKWHSVREEEDINELSTNLLGRYTKKATGNAAQNAYEAGLDTAHMGTRARGAVRLDKAQRRVKGVRKAVDKIAARSVVEAQVELVKALILNKEEVSE